LVETITTIKQLEKEHSESLVRNRINPNAPSNTLSMMVNPSILKFIEEDNKLGIHLLGPFFSVTSPPYFYMLIFPPSPLFNLIMLKFMP
jgi:hypothetical protein